MNINQVLPQIWKYRAKWFSAEKRMLLNVGSNRMVIRPRSYDIYVIGEVFWEQVYVSRLTPVTVPAVVMDLGANIGAFSVWAAHRWDPEMIVAVEMDDENFGLLEENIHLNGLNGKVIPVRVAVWDSNGQVGIKKHTFNHGMNRVCLDPGDDGVLAVTMEKLMDLVGPKRIDFLKMDIEGAEQRLFNETNERLFAGRVHYLISELHPTKGVMVAGIIDYLERLNFTVHATCQRLRTTLILEAVNNRWAES